MGWAREILVEHHRQLAHSIARGHPPMMALVPRIDESDPFWVAAWRVEAQKNVFRLHEMQDTTLPAGLSLRIGDAARMAWAGRK
jgi:hypothetical protein